MRRLLLTDSPDVIVAIISVLIYCSVALAFDVTPSGSISSRSTKLLRSDGTANSILHSLLASNDTKTNVVLEGYVSKRRAIGKSLAFLDIVPSELPTEKHQTARPDFESIAPVQAILRREFWDDGGDNGTFDMYHKILQPGVHVKLSGHAGPSRIIGEGMVFAHSAKFILANSNPQHLRNVLRFAKDDFLDLEEVTCALPGIGKNEVLEGLKSNSTCGELAADILSNIAPDMLLNPSHLMGTTNSQKVALLPPVPQEYRNPPAFVGKDRSHEKQEILSIASALDRLAKEYSPAFSSNFSRITLSGWVQNRRRYQGSLSVLELVDEFSSIASVVTGSELNGEGGLENEIASRNDRLKQLWKRRIYAILHPGTLKESDTDGANDMADIYGNILCAGARVMLQGHLVLDDSSDCKSQDEIATFWVTDCRLLRSSWRPSVVRQILDLLHEGKFSVEEAADALNLSGGYAQAEDISRGTRGATDRQWMAAELTKSLQGENSRVGKISTSMRTSLDAFTFVRDKYPLEEVNLASFSNINKQERAKASAILNESGTPLRSSPEGSRWQRAKKPQLQWMVNRISTVLRSHPDYGIRRLRITDIGGGKGLLSNLLAETFGKNMVDVQVVDISESAISNGMMRAKRRGLSNIRYDAQDATQLNFASTGSVDVVVALHACGALSDVALGHALCQGAVFVICPCCFRSNPQLQVSIPATKSSGIELVTAEEWLGVDETLYNPLKQLAELQGDMDIAGRAMHTINGLRAAAIEKRWKSDRFPNAQLSTSIKSFPIGFSTRNMCLVGKYCTP